MWFMAGRLVLVRQGDVEVWLETVTTPGTEPTSSLTGHAVHRLSAAFDQAQDLIVGMGVRTARAVSEMATRSARPHQVAVEFGLSFTASGGVVVMGASAAATLKVTLTYEQGTSSGEPGKGG